MNDYLTPPMDEAPEIAWSGPIRVSYYPRAQRLLFEALVVRDNQRFITRSFTLLLEKVRETPAVCELIEKALHDQP